MLKIFENFSTIVILLNLIKTNKSTVYQYRSSNELINNLNKIHNLIFFLVYINKFNSPIKFRNKIFSNKTNIQNSKNKIFFEDLLNKINILTEYSNKGLKEAKWETKHYVSY